MIYKVSKITVILNLVEPKHLGKLKMFRYSIIFELGLFLIATGIF